MKVERTVVTGGQKFTNGERIETDLGALTQLGLRRVAQGGHGIDQQFGNAESPKTIRSADSLAWLATHALNLEAVTYHPNCKPFYEGDTQRVWTGEDGRWPAAGPRRSVRMLDAEKPDLVLAYPDPSSRGTWHCVRAALKGSVRRGACITSIWAPGLSLNELATKLREVGELWRNYDAVFDGQRFVIAARESGASRDEDAMAIFRCLGGRT